METCRSDEDEVGIGNNDVISEQGFGISVSAIERDRWIDSPRRA